MKKDLVKVQLLEKAEAPGWIEVIAGIGIVVAAVPTIIILT